MGGVPYVNTCAMMIPLLPPRCHPPRAPHLPPTATLDPPLWHAPRRSTPSHRCPRSNKCRGMGLFLSLSTARAPESPGPGPRLFESLPVQTLPCEGSLASGILLRSFWSLTFRCIARNRPLTVHSDVFAQSTCELSNADGGSV